MRYIRKSAQLVSEVIRLAAFRCRRLHDVGGAQLVFGVVSGDGVVC